MSYLNSTWISSITTGTKREAGTRRETTVDLKGHLQGQQERCERGECSNKRIRTKNNFKIYMENLIFLFFFLLLTITIHI